MPTVSASPHKYICQWHTLAWHGIHRQVLGRALRRWITYSHNSFRKGGRRYLSEGYILSMLKFYNILLSIDDFEATVRVKLPDIAGVEPPHSPLIHLKECSADFQGIASYVLESNFKMKSDSLYKPRSSSRRCCSILSLWNDRRLPPLHEAPGSLRSCTRLLPMTRATHINTCEQTLWKFKIEEDTIHETKKHLYVNEDHMLKRVRATRTCDYIDTVHARIHNRSNKFLPRVNSLEVIMTDMPKLSCGER